MDKDLPKFAVTALVFIARGDELLLVRQSYGKRYWSLPGGSMEHGESVEQAAVREAKEETGLDVRLAPGRRLQQAGTGRAGDLLCGRGGRRVCARSDGRGPRFEGRDCRMRLFFARRAA
jgi:8-oxo-dGTP pyrophosphatase MutT (NUDIX family)